MFTWSCLCLRFENDKIISFLKNIFWLKLSFWEAGYVRNKMQRWMKQCQTLLKQNKYQDSDVQLNLSLHRLHLETLPVYHSCRWAGGKEGQIRMIGNITWKFCVRWLKKWLNNMWCILINFSDIRLPYLLSYHRGFFYFLVNKHISWIIGHRSCRSSNKKNFPNEILLSFTLYPQKFYP